jgi:hypothetical protein
MTRFMATLLVLASLALARRARAEDVVAHQLSAPAQSLADARELPPYSEAAISSNAWARAWLLLEVDASGVVNRAKLLHAPGHDLDAIAVSRAFATRFAPARDGAGRAVRSQLIWGLEWPSYYWLHDHFGTTSRMPRFGASPGDVAPPPCRGSGPLVEGSAGSKVYRDCAAPDVQAARVSAWVYPKTMVTSAR